MALSFIVTSDSISSFSAANSKATKAVSSSSAKNDEEVWGRIEKDQKVKGGNPTEYSFDMKQVEAFRYRMEDALRSVTKKAVREARVKELKNEILNSDKLKVRASLNDCVRSTVSILGTLRRQSA